LQLSPEEQAAIVRPGRALPLSVTPYYMSLIDPVNPRQALRRSVIPTTGEFLRAPSEAADPLGEDDDSPVPGIVHRYPDRVLFLAAEACSVYCRYCTRSRIFDSHGTHAAGPSRWESALDYIASHTEVRDVLISGGDPLTLEDEDLDYLLRRIKKITHVEFVRIGTKVPVVLPQRITRSFVRMLRRHRPVWISIHFSHPDEITPETTEACNRLADAGVPLGSQTVLLKGINDEVPVMKELMHKLLKIRVRPYYLYQCDPIFGSSHFRTSVGKGLEMIEGLRGHTTGYAVPQYVIDAPGGGGKIPLLPEYVVGKEDGRLLLRTFTGRTFSYPDE
jgi:lysine 2,3-aminomutase